MTAPVLLAPRSHRRPVIVSGVLAAILLVLLAPALAGPATAEVRREGAAAAAATSGGTISGRAIRADGKGAAGVEVQAIEIASDQHGEWLADVVASTHIGASGQYVLDIPRDGRYVVYFAGTNSTPWAPYLPVFYDGSPHGIHDGHHATRLTIADGVAVTGIDADLLSEQTEWVTITGRVTDPAGVPLDDIEVNAYCPDHGGAVWRFCRTASTDATGRYSVEMLSRGEYRLGFTDLSGTYPAEYYDDVEDVSLGTSIFSTTIGETLTMPVVRMGSDDSAGEPPTMEVAPSIDGTPAVGPTQRVDRGRWSPDSLTYSFQWLRGGTAISGATGDRYVPVPADRGRTLSVRVTVTGAGASESVVTKGVRVRPGELTNVVAPALRGAPVVGRTLRLVRGDWEPDPVTLSIQWLRDGRPVPGRTGGAYRLTRADRGSVIAARVTASKPGYLDLTRVVKAQQVR